MQVKITRTTVANKQFVFEGQVYDLPEQDARSLVQLGKAEAVEITLSVDGAEPAAMDTEDAADVIAAEAPKVKRGRRVK